MNLFEFAKYFARAKQRKYRYDRIEVEDNVVTYYLWSSPIIRWDIKANTIVFDNCGYYTHTTHRRFWYVLSHLLIRGLTVSIETNKNRKGHEYVVELSGNGEKRTMFYKNGTLLNLSRGMRMHEKDFQEYEKYVKTQEKRIETLRRNAFKQRYDFIELEDLGLNVTRVPDERITIPNPANHAWRGFSVNLGLFHIGDEYGLEITYGVQCSITEKGYDTKGSVIYKIIAYEGRESGYKYIRHIVLLGREYTGQWWMHYLPPYAWLWHIDACERWLLGISKEDEIIGIA